MFVLSQFKEQESLFQHNCLTVTSSLLHVAISQLGAKRSSLTYWTVHSSGATQKECRSQNRSLRYPAGRHAAVHCELSRLSRFHFTLVVTGSNRVTDLGMGKNSINQKYNFNGKGGLIQINFYVETLELKPIGNI